MGLSDAQWVGVHKVTGEVHDQFAFRQWGDVLHVATSNYSDSSYDHFGGHGEKKNNAINQSVLILPKDLILYFYL